MASLSLLTLTSHHHAHLSQASLCVHDSRVLARQLPAPPEQRLETYSHGTRVSVHALFGSMPVRLKHQAAIFSTRSGVEREWGQLVRELVALLVAWPSSVSVSLGEKAHGRELRLKSAADIDLVLGTARLFAQASLADSGHADSWKSVSASARRVRIKGCMSATPVATRRSQMMSLGIQPILNSRDNNILYEAVNDVFRNSSFGVVEDDAPGPTARPRKALERWPMFYLHIMLSGADAMTVEEVVDSSHRVLTSILDLLKAVSYEFLKKQGLRPRAVARSTDPSPRRNSTSKSSTGRSRLSLEPKPARQRSLTGSETRPGRLFDDWDRVKVGWAAPMAKEQGKWPTGPQAAVQRLIGEGGKLLRAPFPDAGTDEQAPHQPVVCGDASGDASADVAAAKRERKRTGALEHRMQPQPSDWLKSLVQSWKNPVFDAVENAIPSLHHACGRSAVEFEPGSISLAGRLSKAALGEAETIAQVDGKFVLVRLPLDKADEDASGSGLVMIDQHAADERCRLEELLDGYFEDRPGTGGVQPVVEALDKPVVFEAPEREEELLRRYREHFAAWGVTYRVQRGSAAGAACRVKVVGLPPSILARCRSEPRVLIDLVRKELWALADDDAGPRPRGAAEDAATTWTSRFRGCPLGILALLCSRSCRSKSRRPSHPAAAMTR